MYYVDILFAACEIALHSRKELVISMLRGDGQRAVGMGRKQKREREKNMRKVKSPGILRGMRESKPHFE